MRKVAFKPGTMLYPLPVVLVSCGQWDCDIPRDTSHCNLITVAWTGTVCSEPAMCYISIRKERYSYDIIKRSDEFVINLTTESMARVTDWCGVKSGRDYDKFREMQLTPQQGQFVKAPLVAESPLNIECQVVDIKELGSHDMFLAEVVGVDAEESLIDKGSGAFQLNHASPLAYSHGKYYGLGEKIGGFGFSVRKKRKAIN